MTPRLIADTLGLYRRHPVLFLVLAAAVVVPYELILLAATGGFGSSGEHPAIEVPLSFLYLVVVWPLVSALHIHAVSDVQRGDQPRLLPVARRGLATLPTVSAATVMSWLGIFGGFLLLVVPGIVLWVRWFVVAPVAALERGDWSTALRRSRSLTEGEWRHVFVFLVAVLLLGGAPSVLLGLAVGEIRENVASFAAGTTLEVILVSFTALATALLYYDLRARRELLAAEFAADTGPISGLPAEPGSNSPPTSVQESVDPHAYSDAERPKGWYVDPDVPRRMIYWDGAGSGWRGETRTPRKLRRRWQEGSG